MRVDLGGVDGLACDWDVVLERGLGDDENVWRSGAELVYQAGDRTAAGAEIVVSVGVEPTDPGPDEVTFTRTDTDETATDSFETE